MCSQSISHLQPIGAGCSKSTMSLVKHSGEFFIVNLNYITLIFVGKMWEAFAKKHLTFLLHIINLALSLAYT